MNRRSTFPAKASPVLGNTAGAPVAPAIGASATSSKLADCAKCKSSFYCCTCHVAEPDVMPVEQMMEVMPGFFERPRDGSIWLASEEAAVRSAWGMSK